MTFVEIFVVLRALVVKNAIENVNFSTSNYYNNIVLCTIFQANKTYI